MKTTRYRFEQLVQEVKQDSTEWLIDELRAILESDKDFTRKCDYIGFSIASIDAKVLSIDEEIKELQALKKNLKSAKELTLLTGAKVFSEYGIDKLEGAGISSITVTKPSVKTIQKLEVVNEEALITAGYYKKVLDEEAVLNSYKQKLDEISPYCSVEDITTTTLPKLKINKRRTKSVPLPLKENNIASGVCEQMEEAS